MVDDPVVVAQEQTATWTAPPVSDDSLRRVSALAGEQADLERRLGEAETVVADLTEALRRVREELLPEALSACGMAEFTMLDGTVVSVGSRVDASIAPERASDAHAWLRANGHGDLIKHVVSASLGMKEDALAPKIVEAIRALGSEIGIVDKESVHSSTLKAFARRQFATGKEIPDSIWAREVKITKLTKKEEKS